MANKVTVKSGQTLSQIAKANNTTVSAILADPANKVLLDRKNAGKPIVFNGTKVAIPSAQPATPKNGGIDATGAVVSANGQPVIPAGTKYKTSQIYNQYGELVTVYTEGPYAGRDTTTGNVVIQGNKPDVKNEIDQFTKDAYAILEDAFTAYGLDSLVPTIRGYMENNLGVEQAKLKLKTEDVYKQRFKGNELRVAKGLNAISEDKYLELENDYSETLRAYGLSDYFGVAVDAPSRLARQQKMADVIGNDISAVEFKTRINTAVTRVKNSDTNTRNAFKALYGINDTDLVKFFLDPTKGSEELQMKAQAAEISGAAVSAGLSGTTLATAEELAKLGIDKAGAIEGYSRIAGYLPITDFLSQIYDESGITYDRATAEAEAFKGTASARRKREQLASMEEAAFMGSSGRLRTGQQQGNTGKF